MTQQAAAGSAVQPRWRDELITYWKDDGPRLLHIAKVAIAMTLAMGLCMRLELRTPATAMVSCVIVMMHQQSGMVIARGFYRGLGMVCGSFAGLLLIALFPQQPLLFLAVLAVWIGVCVFGAAYYRNFQSYGFVLTGYGTAITAIPVWSNPYGVYDNVVFTVSEVVIGVVCASVVSAVVFPQPVAPALYAASRKNFTNLLSAMHTMLGRTEGVAGFDTFLDLIRERVGVESLRSGAVFEDPSVRLRNHVFLDLDRSFLDTVTWIHALHQLKARVAAEADPRALAAVGELIGGLLAVVPNEAQPDLVTMEQVEIMSSRLDAFERDLPALLGRLLQSLADLSPHQRQFVATTGAALFFSIADLRVMCRSYIDVRTVGRLSWPQSVLQAISRIGRTRATANRTAATIAGARAAVAVLAVGAAWIASGWVGGATAIVAVAITSALFALAPNPAVASWQIFCGCLGGWLTGFAFNFLVLPRIDTFGLLAASMAIVVMVGSYLNTFAKTAILGLGFSLYFCFIVGITNPTVYHPSAYLDTGFALLCGIGVAAVAFSVLVPRAGDWISAQYMKQIRGLIAYDARDGDLDDLLYSFELSLRDFILQIASAPVDARVDRDRLIGWAFAALEIGRSMIQLRLDSEQLAASLPAGWPAEQDAWLAALADVFAAATPRAAERALAATRKALDLLPLGPNIAVDAQTLARYRMRALLHFTELTLRDDSLALWQASGAPA
ncbi:MULTISPECIES: FUSC family protein [Paraburkholderia]|uniref:Membrane protein n=1 Tax=Paraburkholderia dioscoreae TaxID=2604047 RepID=A0A5Q4YVJ6_9BURK|nr:MULTISPECIES: FUSC family protein [Paraburkholderia]MDR8399962.1 FUSC family protein [Paraburkholderia sp. USG1]VVD31995.1 Putative membrane protein [Paraburkholderia dioscoreae]